MKFSDKKRDYFSNEEIKRESECWDFYGDELDDFYLQYYGDDELVYLDNHNYYPISLQEKRYQIKNFKYVRYRQVDLSSFTSLEKERDKKLRQLFGESEPEFKVDTFGDLMKYLDKLK